MAASQGLADVGLSEGFEPYKGFFLRNNGRTLLLSAMSHGRRLTKSENLDFAHIIRNSLDSDPEKSLPASAQKAKARESGGRALREFHFFRDSESRFLKYVSEASYQKMKSGWFRFGSPEYYRATSNGNILDRLEGWSVFGLYSGDNQLTVAIYAGYNWLVLCGTLASDRCDRDSFRQKFGSCLIEIDPIDEFIAEAQVCLGATRSICYHIQYEDLKFYRERRPYIEEMWRDILNSDGNSDLSERKLREINRRYFSEFYDISIKPSLFSKPRRYSSEREVRIAFEMRVDLDQPYRDIYCPALSPFIKRVD